MTKEIICSGGEIILVDDEDYAVLSRHPWHYTANGNKTRFYAVTRLNTSEGKIVRTIFMHNMILGFSFYVDHRDNNTKNNTKDNLRPATMQENGWNKGKNRCNRHGANSSAYKGVIRCVGAKGNVYYRIIIKLSKKGEKPERFCRMGPFATEIQAAQAYNKKIVELRGDWAWVNPLPGEAA